MRPELSRVPPFFHNYIKHVPEDDLMLAFKNQTRLTVDFFSHLPAEKIDYAYAAGKWTIKELLQHVIDAERVFSYRALRFARKDPTALPGFDENLFAANANATNRNWTDLLEEFKTVRRSSELLFGSFNDDQLNAAGICNEQSNYVLAWGYIVIGHSLHHVRVIKERYLP